MKVPGDAGDINTAIADLRAATADYEDRDGVRIVLDPPVWVEEHESLGPHWHADGRVIEI